MKSLKRLGVLLLVLMMLFTVACSSSTTETEETQAATTTEDTTEVEQAEEIVLRMAWWGSQTRHDRTVAVIEMYEAENPNVDIQYEFYDFDGYITKLNTLVASDSVWDLFQLGGNFPTYLDKIVYVDDYIESGVIDTSNTTEAFLQTTQYEGNQLTLSSGVNTYGIAYDPAMFEAAGVAEPTDNWTWDDFEAACLTIYEELGVFGCSQLDDFICGCSAAVPQSNKDENFFALTNDALGFDDASVLVDYIQLRADLVEAGAYPDPGELAEITDIETDYIVSGEAAMTWVATNQLVALTEAAGRELKIATVPRKTSDGLMGVAIQSSQMFCISQDSEYPEEAAKFLNYFVTSVEANQVLAGERGNSIISTVREDLQSNADAAQMLVYDYLDKVGGFEVGEVNVISPTEKAEIEDNYDLILEKVIYGELTAEEAADEFYAFAAAQFN